MSHDQIAILSILTATVGLFLWGRWRHDMVALASLLACVFAGLLSADEAFVGFSHPAVITVACVLVLSQGLQTSGAVDALAQRTLPAAAGPMLSIGALTALGAVLSAFMNNVGAMALLMPVAVQIAAKQQLPPGKVLMPLAFGTILGGMTTLIGTPPNLIVAGFRAESSGIGFGMFDYTPIGLTVACIGVVFVALLGWRIVPSRERKDATSFDTGAYLTEVRVAAESKAVGKRLREVDQALEESGAQIIGMARNEFRVVAPNPGRILRSGDILVIEAEPESLASALSSLGLKLEENIPSAADSEQNTKSTEHSRDKGNAGEKTETKDWDSEEITLQELVVMPTSALISRSASGVRLRTRYGLNLLAVSRQGRRSIRRLRSINLEAGDVLLMQGAPDALAGFAGEFGCVPLAKRAIHIPDKRKMWLATAIMTLAIAAVTFKLLSAAIAFTAGMLAYMILRVVPPRKVYETIDWPVVVLLAALIPVAGAMASTGTADVLAQTLLDSVAQGRPVIALTLILIVTMTLSDFMNNAATAAMMCPIALSTASQLGASPDSFLMAVAIGASCAFLTPIGHQNNTLILGPGGFRFGDYWKLGLPMEILVVLVSVPMLLWVWPL